MKKNLILKIVTIILTLSLIPLSIMMSNSIKKFIEFGSFDWNNFLYLLLACFLVLITFVIIFILLVKIIGGKKRD